MADKFDRFLCSFCGKNQHEIDRMVSGGPGAFACNECIDLMHEMIHGGDGLKLTDEVDEEEFERSKREMFESIQRLGGDRRRRQGDDEKEPPAQ